MAGTVRLRHLRHRRLDGIRRNRLDHLRDDLAANGNPAGQPEIPFTAAATNIATFASHGFVTGDGPFTVTSTVALPAGLIAGDTYWLNVIDVNTFTFHPSVADAAADTNEIDITDTGTGVHTLHVLHRRT